MLSKNINRLRRARRTRCKIRELGVTRLSFHKSNQHLYAQLVQPQTMSEDGNSSDTTLAAISTAGKTPAVKGKNRSAAEQLGSSIALKAKELGLNKIAFDRGGNKYHGRVKDFAEAARKSGLEF